MRSPESLLSRTYYRRVLAGLDDDAISALPNGNLSRLQFRLCSSTSKIS